MIMDPAIMFQLGIIMIMVFTLCACAYVIGKVF
jgi:hypothetical protein